MEVLIFMGLHKILESLYLQGTLLIYCFIMKTIYIVLFFAAAFVALYEQSTGHPNLFIMIGCIAIFMMGMMKLMSKVPSKSEQYKEEDNGEV